MRHVTRVADRDPFDLRNASEERSHANVLRLVMLTMILCISSTTDHVFSDPTTVNSDGPFLSRPLVSTELDHSGILGVREPHMVKYVVSS
jgi:hypothetical protein